MTPAERRQVRDLATELHESAHRLASEDAAYTVFDDRAPDAAPSERKLTAYRALWAALDTLASDLGDVEDEDDLSACARAEAAAFQKAWEMLQWAVGASWQIEDDEEDEVEVEESA